MKHAAREFRSKRPASGRPASRTPVIAKQRINPLRYERIPFSRRLREQEFNAALGETFGHDVHLTAMGRGRAGIHLLVKFAIERTGRRRVLLSPYTIADVVNMVVLAGATPVFVDYEKASTRCDLEGLRAALNGDTACVLLTHYHIQESRIDQIASLCRSVGAYLFDDCALAFGGRVGASPVGTLTDASVFSFSSFKLMNFFWGGLVTTHNEEIHAWLADTMRDWRRLKLSDYATQAKICATYDLATQPLIFRHIVFPMLMRRARAAQDAQGLDHIRIETTTIDASLRSRPHPAAFVEWLAKLGTVAQRLERRRAIARLYNAVLGDHAVSAPLGDRELDEGCFANFPVLTDARSRNRLSFAMMQDGFDVGGSPYPNTHRLPAFSSFEGRSENIDALAASTLYLPTHHGVSDDYAQTIAHALSQRLG